MANKELIGTEEWYGANKPHTQVYYATHVKPENLAQEEWLRKDYMYRSFISFSFGGKWIEDFNLIAVVDGDRMQRAAYAGFEDLTTEYEVIDGQYYWGTHMLANQINFLLATDGITQKELEDFKHWFKPGKTEYLILAEHPNRRIKARVAAPPVISVLPFENKLDFNFTNNFFKRKTSSTVYKGNISLSFVMDEPYWEAINTVLDCEIQTFNNNGSSVNNYCWLDANDQEVLASSSKDALKIVIEDGTPITNMLTNEEILFGRKYRIDTNNPISKNGAHTQPPQDLMAKIGYAFIGGTNDNTINTLGYGIKQEENGFDLNKNTPCYFYYPGNAPGDTIISFKVPASAFDNGNIILTMKDNGTHSNILKTFTVDKPAILVALKRAKAIHSSSLNSIEKYRQVRDTVNHKRIRALVISKNNANINIGDMTFNFNSKTGKAVVKATISYQLNNNNITENITENAGDCVKSDYLVIEGTDYFDESGLIKEENCHVLISNTNLTNFSMEYVPMYL